MTDKNERWFNAWKYNGVRFLEELATIVRNNGGEVGAGSWREPMRIHNDTAENWMCDVKRKIAHLNSITPTSEEHTRKLAAGLAKYQKELECAQDVLERHGIIESRFCSDIYFVYEETLYHLSLPDNALFPKLYLKTPIFGINSYSKDACLDEFPGVIACDCMLNCDCPSCDVRELAYNAWNCLVGECKQSTIRRDSKRMRVPNTYNDGYHYETVYEPERFVEFVSEEVG